MSAWLFRNIKIENNRAVCYYRESGMATLQSLGLEGEIVKVKELDFTIPDIPEIKNLDCIQYKDEDIIIKPTIIDFVKTLKQIFEIRKNTCDKFTKLANEAFEDFKDNLNIKRL